MTFSKLTASVALGLGVLWLSAPLAQAQNEIVIVEAMQPHLFMNGGIGKEEQNVLQRAAKDFNLRIDFSEYKDNEFITDVRLVITDTRGNAVFALPSAGPLTNVLLPAGKYFVSAAYKGKTETQSVVLSGKEPKDLAFHWAGAAKR